MYGTVILIRISLIRLDMRSYCFTLTGPEAQRDEGTCLSLHSGRGEKDAITCHLANTAISVAATL